MTSAGVRLITGNRAHWAKNGVALSPMVIASLVTALCGIGLEWAREDATGRADDTARSQLSLSALAGVALGLSHASPTGDRQFPMTQGRSRREVHPDYALMDGGLATLWRTTTDNPAQQARLTRLHASLVEGVRAAGLTTGWWKSGGLSHAQAMFSGERRREVWRQVGGLIEGLRGEELRVMEQRLAVNAEAQHKLAGLRAGAVVAAGATLFSTVFLLVAPVRREDDAAEASATHSRGEASDTARAPLRLNPKRARVRVEHRRAAPSMVFAKWGGPSVVS